MALYGGPWVSCFLFLSFFLSFFFFFFLVLFNCLFTKLFFFLFLFFFFYFFFFFFFAFIYFFIYKILCFVLYSNILVLILRISKFSFWKEKSNLNNMFFVIKNTISPQVKHNVVISNKIALYKLFNKELHDLRLFQEN